MNIKNYFRPNYGFDRTDVEKNKYIAAAAYLIFPLPLMLCRGSRLGKHAANEGLGLLLIAFMGVLAGWIPIVGWLLKLVINLAVTAAMLYCAYKTATGNPVDIKYFEDFHILDR